MIKCFLPLPPVYFGILSRITEMLVYARITLIFAVMIVSLLAGCGNKGPLYLPENSSEIFYTEISSDS
ncbi:MAG: hypothetical protein CMK36_01580 [Porticoccaceae bacterium]|nr:hypothetical protein [Porticoccaceae bacterium]